MMIPMTFNIGVIIGPILGANLIGANIKHSILTRFQVAFCQIQSISIHIFSAPVVFWEVRKEFGGCVHGHTLSRTSSAQFFFSLQLWLCTLVLKKQVYFCLRSQMDRADYHIRRMKPFEISPTWDVK